MRRYAIDMLTLPPPRLRRHFSRFAADALPMLLLRCLDDAASRYVSRRHGIMLLYAIAATRRRACAMPCFSRY